MTIREICTDPSLQTRQYTISGEKERRRKHDRDFRSGKGQRGGRTWRFPRSMRKQRFACRAKTELGEVEIERERPEDREEGGFRRESVAPGDLRVVWERRNRNPWMLFFASLPLVSTSSASLFGLCGGNGSCFRFKVRAIIPKRHRLSYQLQKRRPNATLLRNSHLWLYGCYALTELPRLVGRPICRHSPSIIQVSSHLWSFTGKGVHGDF